MSSVRSNKRKTCSKHSKHSERSKRSKRSKHSKNKIEKKNHYFSATYHFSKENGRKSIEYLMKVEKNKVPLITDFIELLDKCNFNGVDFSIKELSKSDIYAVKLFHAHFELIIGKPLRECEYEIIQKDTYRKPW